MDWALVAAALVGVGFLGWIVISDWRVRSARAVLLVALSIAVLAIGILVLDLASPLAILAAFAVLTPVILRDRRLMPLDGQDAGMASAVDELHRGLIKTSDAYRANRILVNSFARGWSVYGAAWAAWCPRMKNGKRCYS
jgi:hypothetical protein